ncbi:hypothetical protein AB6A40_006654 [Gnathostoma spinigerum]|uniref:Uncharacterized protein n=1 Tax=Gnathostoma spinigerum TaxID=75299 RepID=A0ABD6EK66_9BILA
MARVIFQYVLPEENVVITSLDADVRHLPFNSSRSLPLLAKTICNATAEDSLPETFVRYSRNGWSDLVSSSTFQQFLNRRGSRFSMEELISANVLLFQEAFNRGYSTSFAQYTSALSEC